MSIQPHATISAQELAQSQPDKCGFLRKRGQTERLFENLHLSKHFNWRQKFVVVHDGCCYYFDSELSRVPRRTFSLEGYNRVIRRASERAQHVFAVEPADGLGRKSHYFAAISEIEMKQWMVVFRKNMIQANDGASASGGSLNSVDDADFSDLEKPIFVKEADTFSNGRGANNIDDDDDEEERAEEEEEGSYDSDYDQPKEEWLEDKRRLERRSVPLPPLPTEANNNNSNNISKTRTLPARPPLPTPKADPKPPGPKGGEGGRQPRRPSAPTPEDRVSPPRAKPKPPPPEKPQKPRPLRRRFSEQDCLFDNSDREAAIQILTKNQAMGTFLIRKSRQGDSKVLAVCTDEGIKEYKIFTEGRQVTLDKKTLFNNVDELLEHYSKTFLPNRTVTLSRSYSASS